LSPNTVVDVDDALFPCSFPLSISCLYQQTPFLWFATSQDIVILTDVTE